MTFSFSSMGIDVNSQEIKDAGESGGFELIPNNTKLQFMMLDFEYGNEQQKNQAVDPAKMGHFFKAKFAVVTDGPYKNRWILEHYAVVGGSTSKNPGQKVPFAIAKVNKLAEALGYTSSPDNPLDMKGNQTIFEATVKIKKGNNGYQDSNEITDLKPVGGGMIPAAPAQPAMQPAPAQPAMQPAPAQPAMQPAPAQPAMQPAPAQPAMQPAPAFLQNQ